MKKDKLIAYDLGTGGIKASLFDAEGISHAEIFNQYETYFPKEKFCEQRPIDWWTNVCAATKKLLAHSQCLPEEIACVSLSGHSLVSVPLDKDGKLLLEQVPIWCDMRADDQIQKFFQDLPYLAYRHLFTVFGGVSVAEEELQGINAVIRLHVFAVADA